MGTTKAHVSYIVKTSVAHNAFHVFVHFELSLIEGTHGETSPQVSVDAFEHAHVFCARFDLSVPREQVFEFLTFEVTVVQVGLNLFVRDFTFNLFGGGFAFGGFLRLRRRFDQGQRRMRLGFVLFGLGAFHELNNLRLFFVQKVFGILQDGRDEFADGQFVVFGAKLLGQGIKAPDVNVVGNGHFSAIHRRANAQFVLGDLLFTFLTLTAARFGGLW